MTTATSAVVETRTTDDAGNAAHIVYVHPEDVGMTPQALIRAARVEGFHVIALCGYTWIPQRDPKPLPVCARCLEIYQTDPNANDPEARDQLPEA